MTCSVSSGTLNLLYHTTEDNDVTADVNLTVLRECNEQIDAELFKPVLCLCSCAGNIADVHIYAIFDVHRVSKKAVQFCFCQNFVKFSPILIIFGRKMAKRLKLYEVHSFSTSPNSRHHTTVLNTDVPKCYRMLKVDICNQLSNDLVSTEQTKMWFI